MEIKYPFWGKKIGVPLPESFDKLKKLKSKKKKKNCTFFLTAIILDISKRNLAFRNKIKFASDCPINTKCGSVSSIIFMLEN